MNYKNSVLLFMLLLLFAFSSVPPITAVPSSRSIRAVNRHLYLDQVMIKGRVEMEIQDYEGTGANNHHDPSPPGRS